MNCSFYCLRTNSAHRFHSYPSLHLVLDILQKFGHLIHFGCSCPQLQLGLPAGGGQR